MAEVIWNGDALATKIRDASKIAANAAAEEIVVPDWMENIPWEFGTLGGSITVNDTENGAEVSSSGPYAATQEFDELHHPNPDKEHHPNSRSGRKAHAGRDALNKNQEAIFKKFADEIGAALK